MPALGVTLLVVAGVSLTVQTTALWRLVTRPRWPGLVRTATCRVLAAVTYVGVGLVAVLQPSNSGIVGVAVFTGIQLLWQANAVLDVRLARRAPDPRHHRREAT